ncbi:uncharacterized protein Dwil_GK16196 [Drosophila willistoni]|uniref:Uncharacterized protein n=1 Tax=Drosophila willistoni TaxID=7260 RepID=A0A0Q9X3J4_DROWI|nr:uncharacterized protein Dwil_GK16196 [Drosophila willistoni]
MDPGFSPDDFPRMEPAEPGQIIERNPDSRSSDGDATDSTGISDTVEPGIADTVEPGEIIEIGVDSSSSDDDATDTEEGSTFSGFSPRRDQIDTLEPGEIIERTLNSLRQPQPEEVQEPEPEPNPKEDDDDDDDDPSPAKRSRKQDASYRCPICLESPMHRTKGLQKAPVAQKGPEIK